MLCREFSFFQYYTSLFIFNSMPKRPQKGKANSDEQSEQLQDIMAWGKRKHNFYQDSSNEYSELEEEEQQAKKIYENQIGQLDNQDLYEIPNKNLEDWEQQQSDQDAQLHNAISRQYLTKEIKRTAKLGLQISEFSDTKARALLQTHIQAYLMTLIGLRQLKIPFVEHHPLVGISVQLKQDINKLKHLLASSTRHNSTNQGEEYEQEGDLNEEQAQFDSQNEEGDQGQNQGEVDDQVEQGLRIYQKLQEKQRVQKKAKKEIKKAQRQTIKKPAFLEVKQNEGRLASQQILKNKGLMKKRKKIDRNGRVKLRRKFDKAASKRRAYGHFIRQNPGRNYEGQANIKYGRIASTKLK